MDVCSYYSVSDNGDQPASRTNRDMGRIFNQLKLAPLVSRCDIKEINSSYIFGIRLMFIPYIF